MRMLFMGTPDFAVYSLRCLVEAGHEIVGVVTQPDRPKGRGKQLACSPVKEFALEHGLSVYQPEKIRLEEAYEPLLSLNADLLVTAAFGQLIPGRLLDAPRLGSVNVHASLLPRWRGGAPIHRAILSGDAESGVTIMRMVSKLDAGNLLTTVKTRIEDEDTYGSLHDRLAVLGAELLCDTLPGLERGELQEVVQDESQVTYAGNLTKEDERLDWNRTAKELHNQVRGLNPRPGAFTTFRGEVLKIWQSRLVQHRPGASSEPGRFAQSGDRLLVATSDGQLEITELQPAGKKRMPASDFLRGLRPETEHEWVFGERQAD
ncbi:MAG: methionyl-tRNA formyltransferase [Bacilli bacterium]|nr:methionyl-tRNA formyltransferase [Bacilli bacterium]